MMRRVCLIIAALAAMGCGSSNSNDIGISPSSNGGAISTGSACPLGTWTTDFGGPSCGIGNMIMKTTISPADAGNYVVVATMDPLSRHNPDTGEEWCGSKTGAGLSTSYDGGFFKYTLAAMDDGCTSKLFVFTMMINSTCTQAITTTLVNGCETSSDIGDCGGSFSCPGPSVVAVRSLQ